MSDNQIILIIIHKNHLNYFAHSGDVCYLAEITFSNFKQKKNK